MCDKMCNITRFCPPLNHIFMSLAGILPKQGFTLVCFFLHPFLRIRHEQLEVEPNTGSDMDFSQIVAENKTVHERARNLQKDTVNYRITESEESTFVDDPDVPPLI